MRVYDIILKKRDGEELNAEELNFMVNGFVGGQIPDYQMSAFLMSVYFRGLSKQEIFDFTEAMVNSGERLDLSDIPGIKVDKHSTGGVGDKTTLILCPLVASCGVPIAKMSGRGLGHTGGTLDKLESIPGFQVNLTIKQFIKTVKKIGLAIASQTDNLVPADKKIYALRDVTATVDSIPLIASSVMSKKLAGGSEAILLDIKVGRGALMKDLESARQLAETMMEIGKKCGKRMMAVITNMDEPLGYMVGNALEVKEAIETLQGRGPKDLEELCLRLGAYMLLLGEKANSFSEADKMMQEALRRNIGLLKLRQLIEAQGGDPEVVEDSDLLPQAQLKLEVEAPQEGYIQKIDAQAIGLAAMSLGAGRETKESAIDYAVGIQLYKKVGEFVSAGEPLGKIYANETYRARLAEDKLLKAFTIGSEPLERKPLIYEVMS